MQTLPTDLFHARTCYKHLGGGIGVAITHALLQCGHIKNTTAQQKHFFLITNKGKKWCQQHGVCEHLIAGYDGLPKSLYANGALDLTKSCMDHSHQTLHIAGRSGKAILKFMLARRYCEVVGKRGIIITRQGIVFLRESLGVDWHAIRRNHGKQ